MCLIDLYWKENHVDSVFTIKYHYKNYQMKGKGV